MANLRFYFELLSKSLSIAPQGPYGYFLPTLRNQDVVALEVGLTRQISQVQAPMYSEETVTGWSLRATVGTIGSSLATTATFNPDSSGKLLVGELALNTAGIDGLTDGQLVSLELIATFGTSIYGKRFPVRIEKGIYTAGALVSPPADVALGYAQALQQFVAADGPGSKIWHSPDGTKRVWQYLGNDGQMHYDPL